MRLLSFPDGQLCQTEHPARDIPPYAILSHTWGQPEDEVTFRDIGTDSAIGKPGYRKIEFCGQQAAADGLVYFWVDTCCINKADNREYEHAINSMFRWYQNASCCYVYLTDLPRDPISWPEPLPPVWEAALRDNRWFTRGWTLQELVAPARVDFFSDAGYRLGDKASLESLLREITGIPVAVFRGHPLSDCTVDERFAWAEHRQTTYEEDLAYSLLGIFDVHMPTIYGEGLANARRRLRDEIDKALKGTHREDFSIPFSLADAPEGPHFVARQQELTAIHQALRGDGSRRTAVLHGLGGIGKTQLAIAYTKRHRDQYSAIFWLNIKDDQSIKQSFYRIADQIRRAYPSVHIPTGSTDESDETIAAVKAWLSRPRNTRWLLIFDNYDNPKLPGVQDPAAVDVRAFLPESYQGAVIITTRVSNLQIGCSIAVQKMVKIEDSLEILSNTSGRTGLADDNNVLELIKRLDGLPLALATARAYLYQTTMTFGAYLRQYQNSWARLQATSPELVAYEDRTLYSTWQVSLDQIQSRKPAAAELLRLWAYFDNDDLWLELLQHADDRAPTWLQEITGDEISFHSTLGVLYEYGLVGNSIANSYNESRGCRIHACVHSWVTHTLNSDWNPSFFSLSIRCISSHIPSKDASDWWTYSRRLANHAMRCSELAHHLPNDLEDEFHSLGGLLSDLDKINPAEQMYERALRGKEKALGPDHTSTLNTVNNLGLLYSDQGKMDQAEQMYERALRGYEKGVGPHLKTYRPALNTIRNLAYLYRDINKSDESIAFLSRAVNGFKALLGSSSHEVRTLQQAICDLQYIPTDSDVPQESNNQKGQRRRLALTFLKPSSWRHRRSG